MDEKIKEMKLVEKKEFEKLFANQSLGRLFSKTKDGETRGMKGGDAWPPRFACQR